MTIQGLITSRDVFRHWAIIVREFGPGVLGRCLWAILTHRPTTFLEVVFGGSRTALQ